MQRRPSKGCASVGVGQGSCSRGTSFLLSHPTKIAHKELYISRHCTCRVSSCISFPVAGAFPKPHGLCSQQCPKLCLCSSLLCCTDSQVNMSILKAFLCKAPLCSVVIMLDSAVLCQTIGVGLLRTLQLNGPSLSRGGCSSGQVGIDAIYHNLNHPHYDYFLLMQITIFLCQFSLFTFRTCRASLCFPS